MSKFKEIIYQDDNLKRKKKIETREGFKYLFESKVKSEVGRC